MNTEARTERGGAGIAAAPRGCRLRHRDARAHARARAARPAPRRALLDVRAGVSPKPGGCGGVGLPGGGRRPRTVRRGEPRGRVEYPCQGLAAGSSSEGAEARQRQQAGRRRSQSYSRTGPDRGTSQSQLRERIPVHQARGVFADIFQDSHLFLIFGSLQIATRRDARVDDSRRWSEAVRAVAASQPCPSRTRPGSKTAKAAGPDGPGVQDRARTRGPGEVEALEKIY